MKTITNIIYLAFALFALAPATRAQCPQICDSNDNTALGDSALLNNTSTDNTAIGFQALNANTGGSDNTAIGFDALLSNTIGTDNTAIGDGALFSNTTGELNTAIGWAALRLNTTGFDNVAVGWQALNSNTTGHYNTATGVIALNTNSTGQSNTANGYRALRLNTTGNLNTAMGAHALYANTTGQLNTAAGEYAMSVNTTGSSNIALGAHAGNNLTTGDSNIDIGNVGVAAEANAIRIGTVGTQTNTFIAGISGATVPTGVSVIVDSSGHLGTTTSSARFKEAVKPMDKASEAILALKPVVFRYKKEIDAEQIPQFGLVAEDVEKVNPDLVARDEQGKPYTVRYEAVNAMLLNEFLKEHRTVQEQGATITALRANDAKQEAKLAQQQKQIEALTAGLQKVSAQLDLAKSAPKTVANNH